MFLLNLKCDNRILKKIKKIINLVQTSEKLAGVINNKTSKTLTFSFARIRASILFHFRVGAKFVQKGADSACSFTLPTLLSTEHSNIKSHNKIFEKSCSGVSLTPSKSVL